jgi:hypothetical protein
MAAAGRKASEDFEEESVDLACANRPHESSAPVLRPGALLCHSHYTRVPQTLEPFAPIVAQHGPRSIRRARPARPIGSGPDLAGHGRPGPAIVLAPFTDQLARGASPLKPSNLGEVRANGERAARITQQRRADALGTNVPKIAPDVGLPSSARSAPPRR